ncbi:hypothetical protein L916_10943 [Phytophthora nicotianae]|uniref:Uncharacterized protein n=1 Tax=Phytophthora nicotianae TaxID=4792 RepID=W2IV88_PHYNI|nr:hypothetical protein L916_10943 [Phytophthora nicotianae]
MRVVRVILMTEKKVVKKSDPNLLRDTRGTREETELGDGESQEVVVQDGDLDIAGSVENQEIGGLETDAITQYAQNHSPATTQDNGAEGHVSSLEPLGTVMTSSGPNGATLVI